MKILLNGKEANIDGAPTLRELLESMKIKPELVACELNCKIIKRKDYAAQKISEGDQIEILQMIGGG